jgi:hypothetical protein
MVTRGRPLRRAAELEDRFWMALDQLVPSTARTHLRNAQREVLLAVRALLDYAVERTEAPAHAKRPRRVRVR